MKTSNKLALVAIIILVLLPAASLYVNYAAGRTHAAQILSVIDSLQRADVAVVQYRSPKASPGLLYVTPARNERHNYIRLNIQPEVRIAGDTLVITSTDRSSIYQGSVRLRNLREARFNERVRTFASAPKSQADSLARDSVATDSLQVRTLSRSVNH